MTRRSGGDCKTETVKVLAGNKNEFICFIISEQISLSIRKIPEAIEKTIDKLDHIKLKQN